MQKSKHHKVLTDPKFINYSEHLLSNPQSSGVKEEHIETSFIDKLSSLHYDYRPAITKRAAGRNISGLSAYEQ